MSKLPQIDPATATGAAAELLAQVQKTLGVTPNMTKVMANSPALLNGYLALSGALGGGVIPAPVRERLALATAEANGCEYCLSAHTYIGANITHVDADELDRARDGKSTNPHIEALLTLSNAILGTRGAIDDADLDAARHAGVTDSEIGEVVGHIALNVLTNYFNTLSQVANDWPVVTPRLAA
ncbi:carboxymuconolactone decarboxylase family protein [Nocardioides astragali]|uniref:Carboxymuconolactone decarboxylase family protein n=1 Tax=Nocardioides astragali TaxID=1776736 RepID=A0ABW2N157_9ACTN|nr:carboxymuconolactone decarboxylase family protein [Nocardioides astragali]